MEALEAMENKVDISIGELIKHEGLWGHPSLLSLSRMNGANRSSLPKAARCEQLTMTATELSAAFTVPFPCMMQPL